MHHHIITNNFSPS